LSKPSPHAEARIASSGLDIRFEQSQVSPHTHDARLGLGLTERKGFEPSQNESDKTLKNRLANKKIATAYGVPAFSLANKFKGAQFDYLGGMNETKTPMPPSGARESTKLV